MLLVILGIVLSACAIYLMFRVIYQAILGNEKPYYYTCPECEGEEELQLLETVENDKWIAHVAAKDEETGEDIIVPELYVNLTDICKCKKCEKIYAFDHSKEGFYYVEDEEIEN